MLERMSRPLLVVMVGAKLPISPSWPQAIGQAVSGGQKQEVIQPEPPTMIVNIARLLVSCLHAWNLDPDLDEACKTTLGKLLVDTVCVCTRARDV